MITGIDLTEKNGRVDWGTLATSGIKFAYLKASEALEKVDSAYHENLERARDYGILTGAYHWLHSDLHVGQQVELFIHTVKNFKGMLRPAVCLDIHNTVSDDKEKNIRSFLTLLEKKSGIKAVIYTSGEYWKAYLPDAAWGAQYPLWIDNPGATWPPQVWPWAGWTFWQYAYQANHPGMPVSPGLSRYNGSIWELEAMLVRE